MVTQSLVITSCFFFSFLNTTKLTIVTQRKEILFAVFGFKKTRTGDVTFHCFISVHYVSSDTLTVQSNRTTCHLSIKQPMKLIELASMLLPRCFPSSAYNL